MKRSVSRITGFSARFNLKPIRGTHWQRQAAIRERGEHHLRIDGATLEPWRAGAAVLGCSLSEYVERVLVEMGAPLDAACYLENAIRDRLYLTRAEAEKAAERYELWSVNLRLQGHDLPVLAANAVHRGHERWGIDVDLLSDSGWMSTREEDGVSWGDDGAGEEWKST
jgi:hypothetical protein